MVLLWIGIGIGILIILILIRKLLKTPSTEAITMERRCHTCGEKLDSFACPRCDKRNSFGV